MKRIIFTALAFWWTIPLTGQEKTPEALEFFEKKIRPVLAEHCFACHSTSAKKLKAGLQLDSRMGMLAGGDNGPVLVPGHPDKSRIIEAIQYANVGLKMPPKSKLPDAAIADLRTWVTMGAPWPDDKGSKKTTHTEFDLPKRKKEHWAWQSIRVPTIPTVKDAGWPRSDIDRFLLTKLEERGPKPARAADPRTLVRRLYFDIIGLPPTRVQVEGFVQAFNAADANSHLAVEQVVDHLLSSRHFGERWGRHWLDLTRYAESRGHEFDYTVPNAYQYRDYVVRALNSDVPYNQFVQEHIAGDLNKNPRLHPQEGFNESILGTAFWFLGEEVHSPVDIRQDQADRFDNRLDVMTKTFLGLTIACARCHDHKFDAVSTKDYYALFGILQSSNYRLARFDTITHNRKIAEQLWKLRTESRSALLKATIKASSSTIMHLDDYLLTASGVEDHAANLNPELLKRWKDALVQADKDHRSPLHAFAKCAAGRKRPVPDVLQALLKRSQAIAPLQLPGAEVIVDYRNRAAKTWLPDDVTFGSGPLCAGDIVVGTSPARPIARVIEQAAAERDRAWDRLRLESGTQNESGSLGGAVRPGRTLRTPEFTLNHGNAFVLARGSGMIYASVAQHIMLAGPLHGSLIQKFNTGDKFQWIAINLMPYKGQRTHLEFTPDHNADFAIVLVVQAASPPSTALPSVAPTPASFAQAKSLKDLATSYRQMFQDMSYLFLYDRLRSPSTSAEFITLANWFVQNSELFFTLDSPQANQLAHIAMPILEEQKNLFAEIKLASRLAPAMQDGSGTDEHVFIRGNHKSPGERVPRRFLEALVGSGRLHISKGSGRFELAQQMTDPAVTPFITRVYVNRIWHHLFGRGIVSSVDNFGVLGEAPSHPELLDYLANRFAKEGWSTKKLIRALVVTQAYQMASQPNVQADRVDPQNVLLHRMRLRRLEGEAIRDSILRVSGRLNPTIGGPPIPVYLTPFQDGRGRPGSGPLDGDGRRSVYLSVRRNFLSPFLLAFDTPAPFSTVGRRTVSNVPAQALILLNDPFVHNQAEVWAKRVMTEKGSDADRVRGMYVDAFGRPPSQMELQSCLNYLQPAPDLRRWADLAHVLFNTKEFYFLN